MAEQLEVARLLIISFPLGFGANKEGNFSVNKWRQTIEEAQDTLGPLLREFAISTDVGFTV